MIKSGMLIGGRYEVLNKAGSGGMSVVYKGRDQKLNRFVAIKVLKSEYREDKNTYCYSEKKLASIFWSEYADDWCHVSPATIGRIIKKFNYFFYPYVTRRKKVL
jgi:serine/threonine protein kinase